MNLCLYFQDKVRQKYQILVLREKKLKILEIKLEEINEDFIEYLKSCKKVYRWKKGKEIKRIEL